jgi:ribosome inactivating protein
MVMWSPDDPKRAVFQEDTFGPNAYMMMIQHLRDGFDNYAPGNEFMWVAFNLNVTHVYEPRTIRLCFETRNLYLRGWTISRRGWSFVAAWSSEERENWTRERLSLLPCPADSYMGREPAYIPSEYNRAASGPRLSRHNFFNNLDVLYRYLKNTILGYDVTNIDNVTTAFHLLARTTSEMARFGSFCRKLRGNWEVGISQQVRLASGFEWGPATDRQWKTPPFEDVITSWQNYSKKAENGPGTLQWQGSDVSQQQAVELMGDGVHWQAR